MSEALKLGESILSSMKYIIPIFSVVASIFITAGIIKTYGKAVINLKIITEKPSYLILFIILSVIILILIFKWVIPLFP
jgi:hypothetical protein